MQGDLRQSLTARAGKRQARTELVSRSVRGWRHLRTSNERGQALLEVALSLPILLLIITGIFAFGSILNDYLTLTNATNISTRALSISRGQTTDPCATTAQAFYSAAPLLTQTNLTFTIVLNGSTVWGPAGGTVTCSSATLAANQTAQVTVTYPCNLKVYGLKPSSSCTLTAETAEAIQ